MFQSQIPQARTDGLPRGERDRTSITTRYAQVFPPRNGYPMWGDSRICVLEYLGRSEWCSCALCACFLPVVWVRTGSHFLLIEKPLFQTFIHGWEDDCQPPPNALYRAMRSKVCAVRLCANRSSLAYISRCASSTARKSVSPA